MTTHPILHVVRSQRCELHLDCDALVIGSNYEYISAPVIAGNFEFGLPAGVAKGGGEERLEAEMAFSFSLRGTFWLDTRMREEAKSGGVNALGVKRRVTSATAQTLSSASSPNGRPFLILDGCEIYDRIVIG